MAAARCPICEKRFETSESDAMPFCSRRCRLIDLGRWLGEGYSLPVARLDDEGPCDAEQVGGPPDD